MIHPKFAMLGIRTAVAAFLAALLSVMTGTYDNNTKKSRYMPHQGKQEMARRRRAMQRI